MKLVIFFERIVILHYIISIKSVKIYLGKRSLCWLIFSILKYKTKYMKAFEGRSFFKIFFGDECWRGVSIFEIASFAYFYSL